MKTEQKRPEGKPEGQLTPQKKEYKAPTLTEYGLITNLVNRRFLNGTDGGFVIDNDT